MEHFLFCEFILPGDMLMFQIKQCIGPTKGTNAQFLVTNLLGVGQNKIKVMPFLLLTLVCNYFQL